MPFFLLYSFLLFIVPQKTHQALERVPSFVALHSKKAIMAKILFSLRSQKTDTVATAQLQTLCGKRLTPLSLSLFLPSPAGTA